MTPDQHDTDPATERRLTEAFHALATTEVPATAPRPQHAPRPAAPSRWSRSRRWQIGGGLVVAVAAAAVVAVVVGNEVDDARVATSAPPATRSVPSASATPTTTGTPTTTDTATGAATGTPDPTGSGAATGTGTAGPGLAAVTAAFARVSTATRSGVVTVRGGFEGADLDAGTIRFWRWNGTSWAQGGSSSYPADVRGDRTTAYTATIEQAALLTGMDHASFLVRGDAFTGDSTGFVIVFADGPDGWGAVKAGSDGNLHPSGQPVDPSTQIGLMYDGALTGGLLETVDCAVSAGGPLAACGDPANQVRKDWRWDGTQFVLDR